MRKPKVIPKEGNEKEAATICAAYRSALAALSGQVYTAANGKQFIIRPRRRSTQRGAVPIAAGRSDETE